MTIPEAAVQAIDRFDEAAKVWGWQENEGYDSAVIAYVSEEYRAARKNLEDTIVALSSPAREEWRTIESAPKDGSEFLAWPCSTEKGNIVVKAHWYVHPSVQAWLTDEIDCGDYEFQPTHWRPLPPAPQVRASSEVAK